MTYKESLAIHGGAVSKKTPFTTGNRFSGNELKYLQLALEQNTLFYGHGKFVKRSIEMMKEITGMPYGVACSSGSAAVHLGLIAAGIGPGDEVIVTPNTDYGSILGIIEEGAIPVFCDPARNLQPCVENIAKCISQKTKVVIVVHLAGAPAPVDEIQAFCEPKGIQVVEDCAQSWGTKRLGKPIGTFGTAGCFSTNDYKHLSTGDGGYVMLRDEELYRRVSNYSDKHYDRLFGRKKYLFHHGVNYRMTELQGAVALAQLECLDDIATKHHELGLVLSKALQPLVDQKCITLPVNNVDGDYCTYWWFQFSLQEHTFSNAREEIVKALIAEGIPASSCDDYNILNFPLFQKREVRPWLKNNLKSYPFVQPNGADYDYSNGNFPNLEYIMKHDIKISINRFYSVSDIEEIKEGVLKVLDVYKKI